MSKPETKAAATVDQPSSSGDIRLVLHAIRRRPLPAFLVIVLAGATAAAVWHFIPLPNKSAAVVFHIASQPEVLLAPTLESRIDYNAYRQQQTSLMKSRALLKVVAKDPEIQDLPTIREVGRDVVGWLDKAMTFDSKDGRAEYVRVIIEGDRSDDLLAVLDVFSRIYLVEAYERDNHTREHRQAELKKTYEQERGELKKYQDEIQRIAVELGSNDGTTLAFFDAYRKDELQVAIRDHATARDELEIAAASLAAGKRAAKTPAVVAVAGGMVAAVLPAGRREPLPAAIEKEVRGDPHFIGLVAAVAKAEQVLRETEDALKPGVVSDLLTQARENLRAAREKRDKYYLELRQRVEADLREQDAREDVGRLALLQAEYDRVKLRVDRMAAKVKTVQEKIRATSKYRAELENLRSNIAQKERLTNRMEEELEQLRIEKVPQRVTLSEEPIPVTGIAGNKRLKYTLVCTMGVLFLGFAGIIGREYISRRVTHPDEVSTALGTRLIGTIPPVVPPGRGEPTGGANVALVEAVDTTRTMLLHGGPGGAQPRVLLVTSALSGEGKTTLAGHLAISLARAGFRTLLVDGDVHAPSAHRVFNIPDAPGLSELLREEVRLSEAVRPSPVHGMWVLPAGRWTMATRQLLVGNRWAQLKGELERRFDFVVIDTSPLLLVTDAILLARESDGVILSVMLGVSQVARVAETVSRLRTIGASISGVIVNNVRSAICDYRLATTAGCPTREVVLSPAAIADYRVERDPVDEADLPYAEECAGDETKA